MTIDELERYVREGDPVICAKGKEVAAVIGRMEQSDAAVLTLIARYRAMAKMLKRQRSTCPCDEYGCMICDASRAILVNAEKPLTEETQ